jgi:glyoxylase-like metal-dependent hydrolase (beta-lactamase superfamily II)
VIRVIATPGHTPDGVCFLWHDRLFSGDALAIGGCRPSADPGADPGVLYDSVTRRLFALPGETLVFPGHAFHARRVSTIAEERTRNRSFAHTSRDAFIAAWRRGQGSANTTTVARDEPPLPSLTS